MRLTNLFRANSIFLVAAALLLASCSQGTQEVSSKSSSATPPNATAVTTMTSPVVVAAINPATRTITLEHTDGTEHAYHCGSDITNFSQFAVGDRVNASITDSIAIFIRHSNDPPYEGEAQPVALWLEGDPQPRLIKSNTAEVRAKVLSVDQNGRTLTIQSPGEMTTLPVGPGVDLKKFKKGDDIVLRVSESLAKLVKISGP